ncbi:phosphate-starvation-inducible PsiE family protein [Nitrosomonas sp. Nm33]|uniref:phosphate-starvation-inducible PsiE family protein n=1 Tax=Nitrosomonas sp. Nm33 TaxID=133724 RepID=UPI000895C60D|nr:phosphate-starvation-inducible PsiE family protein [Nitrosomonas sp. Nm33]SDY51771.1 Phosphate-starvation-inducible E [Nitrosomonas sp. Nm33]
MIHQEITKRKSIFLLTDTDWHQRTIQLIVGILMLVLYFWIGTGILSLMSNLPHIFKGEWANVAEHIITDVVLILAVLELIRILQSYLAVGRVKVTFILDVALVVLIGELIGLWYKAYTLTEVGLHISVIAVLTLLRIVSIRFSPDAID